METQGVALAWRSPYQRIPTDQLGYRRSSDAEHTHAADPGLAGVAQPRDTHPRQPLRASQLSDCPFRAVTSSSGPDSQYRTCPGRPITGGLQHARMLQPGGEDTPRSSRAPEALSFSQERAPRRTTSAPSATDNNGQQRSTRQRCERTLDRIHTGHGARSGESSQDSQAQSASSILVTSSTQKPQAIGPWLLCRLDQFKRPATDPHQKASPRTSRGRTARGHPARLRPLAVAQGPRGVARECRPVRGERGGPGGGEFSDIHGCRQRPRIGAHSRTGATGPRAWLRWRQECGTGRCAARRRRASRLP